MLYRSSTSSSYNVGIGSSALYSNTTGQYNTANWIVTALWITILQDNII
jgi:hypothetical protein